jgi:hypothetical protein
MGCPSKITSTHVDMSQTMIKPTHPTWTCVTIKKTTIVPRSSDCTIFVLLRVRNTIKN